MKFKGERLQNLEQMEPGKMYVWINEEFVDYHSHTPKQQAYAIVYLKKITHEPEKFNKSILKEITYFCDVINAPEDCSEFKLFDTIDQGALDGGTASLYTLREI